MMLSKFFPEKVTFPHVLCLLLFLYPLFSTVLRHWNSVLFVLIAVTGLLFYIYSRGKAKIELHKYEKVFLWILASNFIVFILTSTISPPDELREIRFDIELRFLMIIPVYMLLVQSRRGLTFVGAGAICAVLITCIFAFYDIMILDKRDFTGVYSHLYTGPITLIYGCIAVSFLLWTRNIRPATRRVLLLVVLFAAGYAIVYTYSRVTYVAFFAVILLYAFYLTKSHWRVVSVITVIVSSITAGYISPQINQRLTHAYNEYLEYSQNDSKKARLSADLTHKSVGIRMEMWRIAPLALRDHTLFGVGNGNYNKAVGVYIDNKELNPVVNDASHAHNVFVNVLLLKGIIGLVITCLVLFYPFYIYVKTFKQSRGTALTGIAFIKIIFIYSMIETAPFVKANFVATFVLLGAVLFQAHMQKIKERNNG